MRKTIDVYYRSGGYRGTVRVHKDADDKALEAGRLIAHRIYGRGGVVRACRIDSWSPDYSTATYQAFIGIADGQGVTGRDVWIYL